MLRRERAVWPRRNRAGTCRARVIIVALGESPHGMVIWYGMVYSGGIVVVVGQVEANVDALNAAPS